MHIICKSQSHKWQIFTFDVYQHGVCVCHRAPLVKQGHKTRCFHIQKRPWHWS